MTSKGKTVSISEAGLQSNLAEIKSIDEAIGKALGTAAEVRKNALEAVTPTVKITPTPEVCEALGLYGDVTTESNMGSESIDILALAVENLRAGLKQATDEAVTAWIKANSTDTGEAVTTLVTKRETLVNQTTAMAQLLGTEVSIPKAPRTSGGSSSPKSAKVSGAAYWRQHWGGDKEYQSSAQNSVSSLAYYYSEKLTGAKMGAGPFAEWAMTNHQTDVKQATPWSLTSNGLTVGMDVVSPNGESK